MIKLKRRFDLNKKMWRDEWIWFFFCFIRWQVRENYPYHHLTKTRYGISLNFKNNKSEVDLLIKNFEGKFFNK